MNKKLKLSAIMVLLASVAVAQTYTEIFEGGWGQAINHSKAIFIDLDNDGLLDMIIGEYDGSLVHYEQSTANTTNFTLISRHFNEIDVRIFAAPTFTDLENDGLLDLIIGEQDGNLNHYKQFAVDSDSFTLVTEEFNGIDVGSKSIPNFIDLDEDGLLDLILSSQDGTLYHYEQDASDPNAFTLISNNFSDINSGFFGTLCFTDLDHDDLFDMFTGSNQGNLKHYEQDALGSFNFSLVSDRFNDIDVGRNYAATFTDLDNNGLLDLIVGEYYGSLNHYEQEATGSTIFNLKTEKLLNVIDVGRISSPIFSDLDSDGLLDMVIGAAEGDLIHYEQNVFGSNDFTLMSSNFNGINVGEIVTPAITDLDGDGLMDLVIGEYDGNLNHYEQTSVGSTIFGLVSEYFNEIDVGKNSRPCFTDLDNDDLLDMIVGEDEGDLHYYEQDGIGTTTFTLISDSLNGIDVGYSSNPVFTDLDNDSLLDMIVGESDGNLNHYEQDTAGSLSFTLISENLFGIKVEYFSKPVFIDINGDGLEDLLLGNNNGGVRYFQRNKDTGIEEHSILDSNPRSYKLLQNYPNPFNPSTKITYNLPHSTLVTLKIYNIQGQEIKTLVNEFQSVGMKSVTWNGLDAQGKQVTSGLYFYHINAGDFTQFKKMILVQ